MKVKRAKFCGNCKWGYFEPKNWRFQFDNGLGYCSFKCVSEEPELNCDKIADMLFLELQDNVLTSKEEYLECRRSNHIEQARWYKTNIEDELNKDGELYDLFLVNYNWWVTNSENLLPIHKNTVCAKHEFAKDDNINLESVEDVLNWLQEQLD